MHESERTRVTRLYVAGRPVVCKEPLGPDAESRLRHETAILERLRGVVGVPQLVEAPQHLGAAVVVHDVDGVSLAERATPLPVDDLVSVGVGVARVVAEVHRRGVMHRDITPANILISRRDGAPCLVDFALATPLAELRPEFTHHTEIVGTLPYLAPEQTGRTDRPVDQRADLYALGATLYELATGAPPFGCGDPLRLTHAHLARVAVPPSDINPAVPAPLSEIVMHLLEKEPDNRYQTAEGLLHDLELLRVAGPGAAGRLRVGERDVPLRLLPPSRLVGRDDAVAVLEAAFEDALAGRCRGVLVSGAPGVGKTALVDKLRPVVTGSDGWFVAGKFDQYRRDLDFDAVLQAFRALGRLLLAEPEDELARVRERIRTVVGPNVGLLTAVVPEFAALLAVPPDPGDPLTAQVRAQRTAVDLLRAVVSPKRPLVLFVDDLQWAGRTPIGFVDAVLSEEQIDGLLLVGAYRDDDVDATHPLAAPLTRCREQATVRRLPLGGLPASGAVAMVAEMLHADPAAVADLVEVVSACTAGNPYEMVEVLNALRRDGMLSATTDGWRWDAAAVRARLGQAEVAELLATRVAALPEPSREAVEAMACFGGRAEVSALQTATAAPPGMVEQRLAPALDEGLLVMEPGKCHTVRFRHDRIREVVLRGLDPLRRRAVRLAMARRLAGVPARFSCAAEQYLPVIDALDDPAERRMVVGLLRRAARQATLIGNHALVSSLLTAALRLVEPGDTGALVELHTGRHTALYSMGQLEEADEEYRTIEGLRTGTLDLADATVVQTASLTYRNRFAEAITLGVRSLRALGIAVPGEDRLPGELDRQFDHLYRWLEDGDAADDLARPELTDARLLVAARLINAILPASHIGADHATLAWLSLEALRIWTGHGPAAALLGPVSHTAFAAGTVRGDWAAGWRAMRRVLALGEARGYEPATSQVRFLATLMSCWFEPIEYGVRAARRAREGLIAGGDLVYAGYTYHSAIGGLLDSAPALETYAAEVEAGLDFVRRTGGRQIGRSFDSYRWLAGVLRGDSAVVAGTAVTADRFTDNVQALLHARAARALAAAVFGDQVALARHTTAAMPLLPNAASLHTIATMHLLHGLALAGQARDSHGDERGTLLRELDGVTGWLAERAAGAPDNYLHLLRLLEAERAWAAGDFRAAVLAFDAARDEVADRQRPWHRALITERAARFYLTHGVEHAGYDLLALARHEYLAWGATAKVDQLDWAYPTLRPPLDATAGRLCDVRRRSTVTTGTLDLLGILSASRALSSETGIEGLHSRLVEVLSAMTGATAVRLLLWSDDRQQWLLPDGDGAVAPLGGTGQELTVPMSVLRYAQRSCEPLVVSDATRDDRFARDPYFTDVTCCSLLAVPIHNRGTLRAVLLLENRLIRGAFATERLGGVKLIAGQLAVSLDNIQLYAALTTSRARIVAAADQTRRRIERDLHDGAQQQLVALALELRTVQAAVPPELVELRAQLDRLVGGAADALDALREIARGIHPAILTEGGLGPALRTLARRSPIPVRLVMRVEGRLPERVEVSTYYVVAEALTNAAKHAHASAATVTVEPDTTDGVLRVAVQDDGVGGADLARGTGLVGLKDRVEALGGHIVLDSPPGAGTSLRFTLPFAAAGATQCRVPG
ncbi:AAA family ATPase [Dactylosporangium aurantiacum]|uniref:AAA family ATPase n=1 Tax=Dactylosporangium aurantiacum TaxID=35754 RepID=A0A9Q9IGB4_9ACTN|nr:AAA family ATPase [Dactylosporangium aurantiacum]MDG6102185.1 AAA family ATPase [Dactylosporangium aurantiacum]UWZ53497.1 AAA family ATPase [Dactylosporangium aurantiacum]